MVLQDLLLVAKIAGSFMGDASGPAVSAVQTAIMPEISMPKSVWMETFVIGMANVVLSKLRVFRFERKLL